MRSRSPGQLEPLGTTAPSDKGDSSSKTFGPRRGPLASLAERIERALVLAAYVVVRHGPVYAPLVDRLERELEAAQWNDPTERAKRILEAYGADGMQKRLVPRRVVSRESDADPNAFGGLPGGTQRSRERNPRN